MLLRTSAMTLVALANLLKMALTLSPFSMEIILEWSSSLIQTKKFLASLWKIPRASGQWRPHPEDRRRVESGSWKRFPLLRRSSISASDMPVGLAAYERDPWRGQKRDAEEADQNCNVLYGRDQ